MPEFTLISTDIDTRNQILGKMTAVAAIDEQGKQSGIVLFEYSDNPHLEKELEAVRKHFGTREIAQEPEHPLFQKLREEFELYLEGKLKGAFSVPLMPIGSDFQKEVWNALWKIPYGATESYGQQTARMGRDLKSVRAVAGANGRNKLPILIPCHRVIGNDGTLTGYSGGIERKQFLLELERKFSNRK